MRHDRHPPKMNSMDWKPFTPTWPSSFFALPVGQTFYAKDLAGLSTSSFAVGIAVTRTNSGPWTFDLDTYRVDPSALVEKRVKVDRWPLACTGSDFVRTADRHFPPGPLGHYPRALPPELGVDVSSSAPDPETIRKRR